MKKDFRDTIQTIKKSISVKKILALVLGAGLLVSSFLLGMAYADNDFSDKVLAYDDRQENNEKQNGNATSKPEQGTDAITSATTDSGTANNNSAAGNSGTSGNTGATGDTGSSIQQFTLATLATYNGKNGSAAYIAYSGKVYDVTSSPYFINGVHKYDSSVKAGTDITVQMNQAPSSHTSRNYIATLPQVGVLVEVITNSSANVSSPGQTTPVPAMKPLDANGGDDAEEDDD